MKSTISTLAFKKYANQLESEVKQVHSEFMNSNMDQETMDKIKSEYETKAKTLLGECHNPSVTGTSGRLIKTMSDLDFANRSELEAAFNS